MPAHAPTMAAFKPRTLEQLDAIGGRLRRTLLPELKPSEALPMRALIQAVATGLPTVDGVLTPVSVYEARWMPCEHMWATTRLTAGGRALVALCSTAWDEVQHGVPRTMFTLAHELAHVALHLAELRRFGEVPHTAAKRDPQWCTEAQANRLAGALLMPGEALRVLARRGELEPAAVAQRFGVSELAATVRIAEFSG